MNLKSINLGQSSQRWTGFKNRQFYLRIINEKNSKSTMNEKFYNKGNDIKIIIFSSNLYNYSV